MREEGFSGEGVNAESTRDSPALGRRRCSSCWGEEVRLLGEGGAAAPGGRRCSRDAKEPHLRASSSDLAQ